MSRSAARIALVVFAALTMALVVSSLWRVINQAETAGNDDTVQLQDEVETEVVEPEIERVTSRLLFGGDVYWGRLFERNHPGDFAFPFSGLNTLNKQDYNAWIVNVECPITDEVVSFEAQWEAIQFNCRPEYLEEAAKWFDAVSLANNHTDNVRGEEGLATTRTNLEQAGIQHFGHYEPGVLEDLCEILAIEAVIAMDDGSSMKSTIPVALCGYHGVFRTFTEEELEYISNYSKHFVTIAMPHAGAEYQPTSDVLREEAYRTLIDNGADAVIGNHPHWVQNTESYKGKLIAYSMGNFIFDQQFNAEVTRSVAFDMTIELNHQEGLAEYFELLGECSSFKDTCLERAKNAGLTKPDANFIYEIVPTRTTGLVTALADDEYNDIAVRTDWKATIKALHNYTQNNEETNGNNE